MNKLKISVLSKRDSSKLLEIIKKKWPQDILVRVKSLKVYEIEVGKRILKSENFTAVQINEDTILPFLGEPENIKHFPQVVVDMGAVKFVCNAPIEAGQVLNGQLRLLVGIDGKWIPEELPFLDLQLI